MRRRGLVRRLARLAPVVFAALLAVPAAQAGNVRIAGVDPSGFPILRVTVVAPHGSRTPVLREDGRPIVGATAVNLGRGKSVVVVLDRSQSMRGRPLRDAIAAARTFVGAAAAADRFGVVAFGHAAISLGAEEPPGDAAVALSSIGVDGRSGTALFDAVSLAARSLRHDPRPGRAIVLVTDGADTSSLASLGSAVAAARAAHASVYAIGIAGPQFTPDDLKQLSAETGGSYRTARGSGDLASIYRRLADELSRTWQISYPTARRPGDELRLQAVVPGSGRATADVKLTGVSPSGSPAPSPALPDAVYSGVGTLAVAGAAMLLVLFACGFWFASREGSWLSSRLEAHLPTAGDAAGQRRGASGAAARKRIADVVENAFANLKHFRALQRLIERADVPWRAGELAAAAAGSAFLAGIVFAVLFASPLLGLLGMVVGFAVPIGVVRMKAGSRLKRFDNQLPDVLITVAASLKAGHSFRQGIQSVVDEGAEPAAKEFKRVLTETQLGKGMDDALADMADRVGSEDLTFVVTAVTIQRQIGGSLAGLFDMVAETVRQRQQFARKIRSLTAMGRMSAYVLVALPFFMAFVVSLMNSAYMAPLYHSGTGHAMIGGGLVMMALGSLMLKKIVSFRG